MKYLPYTVTVETAKVERVLGPLLGLSDWLVNHAGIADSDFYCSKPRNDIVHEKHKITGKPTGYVRMLYNHYVEVKFRHAEDAAMFEIKFK